MKQSLHSFHRGLALLLVVMLLASLILPAAASAEGILSGADMGQEPVPETGGDAGDADEAGTEAAQGNSSPADEPVIQDPPGQNAGIPEAGGSPAEQSAAPARDDSSPPEKSNSSAQGEGAISSAVSSGGASAGGTISSAGGASFSGDAGDSGTVEFFVASYGSDSCDGSPEAPFATLSRACAAAAGAGTDCVVLVLLTDLACDETLSFYGKSFVLTSENDPCTVTRSDDFRSGDGDEEPLIVVGDSGRYGDDGEDTELVLEYITLDDAEGEEVGGVVIEVCDGARLVVGEEASVLGRDSMVSVHGDSEAEIHVYDSGTVRGGTPILEEEGCFVTLDDGADVPGYLPCEEDDSGEEDGGFDEGEGSGEGSITGGDGDGPGNDIETPEEPEEEDSGDDESLESIGQGDVPVNALPLMQSAPSSGTNGLPDTGTLSAAAEIYAADAPVLAAAAPMLAAANDPDGFSLSAPESISKDDEKVEILTYIPDGIGAVKGYSIPYTVTFKIPESLATLAQGGALALSGMSVRITLTLPESVLPQVEVSDGVTGIRTDNNFNILHVTASSFEGLTLTLDLGQSDDWTSHLSDLASSLRLTVQTVLPKDSFPADPLPQTITAEASLSDVTYTAINSDQPASLPYERTASADTDLLGDKTASVLYDPNGGSFDPSAAGDAPAQSPIAQDVSPSDSCALDSTLVPVHADVDNTSVLFYGWSAARDTTIYSSGDEKPDTVDHVSVADGSQTTVFAVYSYDVNEDGIPDVDQELVALIFDANGGTGAPGPQYGVIGTTILGNPAYPDITIPQQEPTMQYYTFLGWAESPDAAEAAYRYNGPGRLNREVNDVSEDTTLYAVWERSIYLLAYDANGGVGAPATQEVPVAESGDTTAYISSDVPTRTGYHFTGWSNPDSIGTVYQPGNPIHLTSDTTTLVAVWEENPSYTLSFHANGGRNAPSSVTARSEEVGGIFVAYPEIPSGEPTRSGAEFLGWAETANATEPMYDPGEVVPIEENTTLYAVWARYYTLYFNGTGASDAPDPISALAIDGVASMTIPDKVPTRNRYDFQGWSPSRYGSASFSPGEDVKLTGGDVTLYAVWKRNTSTSSSSTTTNGKAPRTGDESRSALYAALALGSAAALGAGIHILKKKRT